MRVCGDAKRGGEGRVVSAGTGRRQLLPRGFCVSMGEAANGHCQLLQGDSCLDVGRKVNIRVRKALVNLQR
jgi:hypothetical protein